MSFLNPQKLPSVIETEASDKTLKTLFDITFEKIEFLHERLLQYGALLFRGFEIENIGQFEDFAGHFSGKEFFNYAGGVSPRLSLGGVYTSTKYPADLTLGLHNELSYSQSFPRRLYFFCVTEPQIGGETTLGDSRKILRSLNPQLVDLVKAKKVRYDRCLQTDTDSDYSWRAAFETDDEQTVEKACQIIGANFEWKSNGELCISQVRPATAAHARMPFSGTRKIALAMT